MKDTTLNKSDPYYYEKLFSLDLNKKYKILDTAGKSPKKKKYLNPAKSALFIKLLWLSWSLLKLNNIFWLFFKDYVIPPNEYNSIFIMTNFIETIQTPGNCDEVIH